MEKRDHGTNSFGSKFTSETETIEVTRVFAKVTGTNRHECGRVESDCGGGFTGTVKHTGESCRFGSRDAAIEFVLARTRG